MFATVTGPTPPGIRRDPARRPRRSCRNRHRPRCGHRPGLSRYQSAAAPGCHTSLLSPDRGGPTATKTASARRECTATCRVMWWQTVTVAPSPIIRKAMGLPTISECPITTTHVQPFNLQGKGFRASPTRRNSGAGAKAQDRYRRYCRIDSGVHPLDVFQRMHRLLQCLDRDMRAARGAGMIDAMHARIAVSTRFRNTRSSYAPAKSRPGRCAARTPRQRLRPVLLCIGCAHRAPRPPHRPQ